MQKMLNKSFFIFDKIFWLCCVSQSLMRAFVTGIEMPFTWMVSLIYLVNHDVECKKHNLDSKSILYKLHLPYKSKPSQTGKLIRTTHTTGKGTTMMKKLNMMISYRAMFVVRATDTTGEGQLRWRNSTRWYHAELFFYLTGQALKTPK